MYTIIAFHVSAVQLIHVCPERAQGWLVNCCEKFIIGVKLTANTAGRQAGARTLLSLGRNSSMFLSIFCTIYPFLTFGGCTIISLSEESLGLLSSQHTKCIHHFKCWCHQAQSLSTESVRKVNSDRLC